MGMVTGNIKLFYCSIKQTLAQKERENPRPVQSSRVSPQIKVPAIERFEGVMTPKGKKHLH
jgi:hypothetical protein